MNYILYVENTTNSNKNSSAICLFEDNYFKHKLYLSTSDNNNKLNVDLFKFNNSIASFLMLSL